jgi:putative membrane protein
MNEEVRMKKYMMYGMAVLALSAGPAFAQSTPGGSSSTQPSASAQRSATAVAAADQEFVKEAAAGGMAEVELGKLAGDKAADPQVKQFAQKMVDDHTKANDELKKLAEEKNITLPSAIDAQHKATHDRLEKLSGAAFDRAYIQDMLQDHQKDVSEFRKQASSAKDADIKAWAAKTLPTLEQHLTQVQSLSRTAVGTSGQEPSTSPRGASAPDSPRTPGAPPNPIEPPRSPANPGGADSPTSPGPTR